MSYEKLTGEIHTNDITELVHELNKNKNKFRSFLFDRKSDHFTFEIIHDDPKNEKRLLSIFQKHIARSKGNVNREEISR
jgi:hypothetical protein